MDVSSTATADQVKRGMLLYGENCAFCHGIAASSGGVISDLRYSAPAVFAKYRDIVLNGTYVELGMPSFRGKLTEADIESIRAFVLFQRAKLAAPAQK